MGQEQAGSSSRGEGLRRGHNRRGLRGGGKG